ncbi:MAG: hypothetical protein H5U07_01945 [Candidatus Aminicenantes bacterium]|nr:hypothetical protein [Candidatus Aminicenantes bacterium]
MLLIRPVKQKFTRRLPQTNLPQTYIHQTNSPLTNLTTNNLPQTHQLPLHLPQSNPPWSVCPEKATVCLLATIQEG